MSCEAPTDQRFHSLVRNDHSLGETSRSLPSGYSIVRDRRTVTTTLNVGELLNLVGLEHRRRALRDAARDGRPRRPTSGLRSGFDPLLLLTSVLGLVWNLCALPVYELPKMGFEGPFPYIAALGFAALGFLPAVVVHSVLRDERHAVRGAPKRTLAVLAYAVSAIAAVLHVEAAATAAAVPSSLGMRLLTYTFVALVVPLVAVTRGRPGAGRALWAAALATFAVSALHLSQLHRGEASWPVELVGHHASLPLAFAILYQDYRFALADLFLKRALSLLAIVTVAFAAIATFGVRSTGVRAVRAERSQATDSPGHALGRHRTAVSRAPQGHDMVRGRRCAASAGLPIAANNGCPCCAGQGRRRDIALVGLRIADASAQRRVCGVARVDSIGAATRSA